MGYERAVWTCEGLGSTFLLYALFSLVLVPDHTSLVPIARLQGAKKTQKDGKDVVEVEVPTVKEDIDAMWLHMRKDMAVKTVEVRQKRSAELKQEDHYRNFRTVGPLCAAVGTAWPGSLTRVHAWEWNFRMSYLLSWGPT